MRRTWLQRRLGDAGCHAASNAFRGGRRRRCRPDDCPRARMLL